MARSVGLWANHALPEAVREGHVVAVVDDDVSVRALLRRLLRREGFAVEAFPSADAFVAAGAWRNCSLVLTDLQMPGMDGAQLVRHLRAQGVPVPVLVLSASQDQSLRAEAMRAGAESFLEKPFEVQTLISEVRALSGQAGGEPMDVGRDGTHHSGANGQAVGVAVGEPAFRPHDSLCSP